MALRIKEEYKEWSIGGGSKRATKLKNLDPSLYEDLYKTNPEFFVKVKDKKEIIIENDTDSETE